jgi:hypothetical protein
MKAVVCLFTVLSASAATLTPGEQESFLLNAQIVSSEPLATGITRSYRVMLTDHQLTHAAHVQLVDVSKPEFRSSKGIERNFRDSYKFNIAAYRLAKLLGMDMVPVSVEREFQGKPGAFTWWVDDLMMSELDRRNRKLKPADYESWNDQFHNVMVFDNLIYNVDRTQENLLITKDWKLKMIDHTRAFRTEHKLRDPGQLVRCDQRLLDSLRKLEWNTLAAEMTPYLTAEEIQGILARRDLIVKHFESEIAAKGRDAVLTNIPRRTPQVSVP